jgi:quercetin dioxygenase-like cupin family protein
MPAPPFSSDWSAIDAETVMDGVTRQTVHGERQTMVRYVYAPGAVFPVHSHPEEQCTIVISGRIRFEVNGESIELGPGGVLMIPSGVPHGARVIGDDAVESFNSLSPRRMTGPKPLQRSEMRRAR